MKPLFYLFAVLLLLSACSSLRPAQPRPEMALFQMVPEDSGPVTMKSISRADENYPGAPEPEKPDTGKSAGERLHIYFGNLRLRVGNPEETRSQITDKANKAGGYVEAVYQGYIIIRIPKELFQEIFNEIMQLGEVLGKSIETYDVTEAFQDLSLRRDIAVKARERLFALLENTVDVEQRLKILKEIKRLTEEIEAVTLQLDSLGRLVSLSRITVELIPRLADTSLQDKGAIPFKWIAGLDPFYQSVPGGSPKPRITLPADFAVFGQDDYYHAETADGVKLRIGRIYNFPEGDGNFWQQALLFHLGSYYQTTEVLAFGELRAVLFTSKDKVPFYYLVGVIVAGNYLQVVEVFFPGREQYDSKSEALKKSLEGLRVN